MIAYDYKIHAHIGIRHDSVPTVTVEAYHPPRHVSYPVFEVSWKADGTPFGAYRMLPDNTDCEKCEHTDIPPVIYSRFVEEMTRLRDVLGAIVARAEGGVS